MLTDAKRKKLLAGVLAAVMLTGIAGCGSDKDSEWKNDNAEQEKKDDDGGGGIFHGFFPWFFIGRTFGVGPAAGMYNNTSRQQTQTPAPKQTPQQGAAKQDAAKGAAGQTVQQGSAAGAQKSTLGSTGTSGKSGIGSGLSRSSGSAIS